MKTALYMRGFNLEERFLCCKVYFIYTVLRNTEEVLRNVAHIKGDSYDCATLAILPTSTKCSRHQYNSYMGSMHSTFFKITATE